eukprot:1144379-Pelagomonas_calceolata.AAC.1
MTARLRCVCPHDCWAQVCAISGVLAYASPDYKQAIPSSSGLQAMFCILCCQCSCGKRKEAYFIAAVTKACAQPARAPSGCTCRHPCLRQSSCWRCWVLRLNAVGTEVSGVENPCTKCT